MSEVQPQGAEFSRIVAIDLVGAGELQRTIEASAEERAALARRFGLLSLDRLHAELRLRRVRGGTVVRVSGRFEAEVTQSCVVTLRPVRRRLAEEISLLFSAEPDAGPEAVEVWVDPEAEDPPEPAGPEGIDLGEMVAQQLALAIDPYPRAEGAALERVSWGAEAAAGDGGASPFAALDAWRRKR